MKASDEHIALEAAIYEAAVVPELWPAALAELNRLSDTGGTAMVCINERGVHMMTTANMDEIGRRFVSEGWMNRNSRASAAFAKGIVGLTHFAPGEDLLSEDEHLSDPMINELFRPYGFGRVAGEQQVYPAGHVVVNELQGRCRIPAPPCLDRRPVIGLRQHPYLMSRAREPLRVVPPHARLGAGVGAAGVCGEEELGHRVLTLIGRSRRGLYGRLSNPLNVQRSTFNIQLSSEADAVERRMLSVES